jgi:hypothetical protein
MNATYRLKQGLRDILAFTRSVDADLVRAHLSEAQYALFSRMTHAEQLHSVNVLRTVLAQEPETPPDLAVAALLHDVGKSRYPLNVAERTLAVALKRLLPRHEARMSERERFDRLHAPFVVRRHHPRWSADLLRMTGGTPRAIWLVEHHADDPAQWQHHPDAPLLARLQRADNAN